MDLRFSENDARSTYALAVKGYRKAFGERTLFEEAGFDILRGEKVALVGKNGCGKTSFIRDLIAQGDWNDAVLRLAPSMRVGYVSQAQDNLPKGKRVREAFEALGAKSEDIRKLLKRFLFANEDLERPIGQLSGGELNRLQLARAVWLKANFLILDEPTNHLDIAAREAVEEALNEFDGTILLVSHDRFLLESVAERVLLADGGRFLPYEGNFSEFWRDAGYSATREIKAGKGIEGRAAAITRTSGETAAKNVDLADRIETMERQREMLEKKAKTAIEARDFASGRKISSEIEELARKIGKLYEQWCT